MAARAQEGQGSIRALARGLEVLQLFTAERPDLSLTEVAELTGLPLATAQRVLRTLEGHRFVRRRFDRGPYSLGSAILPLIPPLFGSMTVPDVARPYIEELATQTEETANLAVLEHGQVLYLVAASGNRLLTSATWPGLRLPAHCTALGKALLAQLDETEARAVLGDPPFERRTVRTRTTWPELASELDAARQRGYARSDQELEEGLCGVAMAVDIGGDAPAAVNVSGPASRWGDDYVEGTLVPALHLAAQGISVAFRAFLADTGPRHEGSATKADPPT